AQDFRHGEGQGLERVERHDEARRLAVRVEDVELHARAVGRDLVVRQRCDINPVELLHRDLRPLSRYSHITISGAQIDADQRAGSFSVIRPSRRRSSMWPVAALVAATKCRCMKFCSPRAASTAGAYALMKTPRCARE